METTTEAARFTLAVLVLASMSPALTRISFVQDTALQTSSLSAYMVGDAAGTSCEMRVRRPNTPIARIVHDLPNKLELITDTRL